MIRSRLPCDEDHGPAALKTTSTMRVLAAFLIKVMMLTQKTLAYTSAVRNSIVVSVNKVWSWQDGPEFYKFQQ